MNNAIAGKTARQTPAEQSPIVGPAPTGSVAWHIEVHPPIAIPTSTRSQFIDTASFDAALVDFGLGPGERLSILVVVCCEQADRELTSDRDLRM